MGNRSTKSSMRNAIIYLNISADSVAANDDKFWSQIWSEDTLSASDILKAISTQEIRMLRDGSPKNFAILAYKMIERLCLATGTLCNTHSQQTAVLNATKILIRLLPCAFEDKAWVNFFAENHIRSANNGPRIEPDLIYPRKSEQEKNYKSYLPIGTLTRDLGGGASDEEFACTAMSNNDKSMGVGHLIYSAPSETSAQDQPDLGSEKSDVHHEDDFKSLNERDRIDNSLMKCLIESICDLLFCPEFTVTTHAENYLSNTVDAPPEDLKSLTTCDYVWEPGVGFESSVNSTTYYDRSRSELLRLLLACLSTSLYELPSGSISNRNRWVEVFASSDNRHALPLFTSLLNTVFIYKPSKLLPFNHLLFEDTREELVELSIQILIATLDYHFSNEGEKVEKNLFIEYMSRIHKDEDFLFIIKGFTRSLNARFGQGYLINSSKYVNFEQELLILFWRLCNLNKRFVTHILKTNEIIDIVVPILCQLNDNFQESSKTAMIHVGVFILLILSGERNFGVRLNKPYLTKVLENIPTFAGSHADLMIIVFHKLILYGHNLSQLYDFLMTIVANTSPYLKTLSMMACKCLIQMFEIFSTPSVILTEPNHHQMVILLLEIFNNLLQYQFDGNANLVYAIINKQDAFIGLLNLPSSSSDIQKILNKLIRRKQKLMKIRNENNVNQGTLDQGMKDLKLDESVNNDKATVSSSQTLSRPQVTQVHKQEVSLVKTPDICLVVQSVHPRSFEPTPFEESQNDDEVRHQLSLDEILDLKSTSTPSGASKLSLDDTVGEPKQKEAENFPIRDTSEQVIDSNSFSISLNDQKMQERWKPTPDWVKQWKSTLPIHTTLRMIEVLTPQLDRFKQEHFNQVDELEILKFIQKSTLVGLLPIPHPILIRKYRTNSETTLWFRACTWGIIYVRNSIWTDTAIRLIKIV